jgi:two-component system NtrC family sensor kinase
VVHHALLLIQIVWLMITYLNYADEPTTFLAKLVSLFLCLTLFLLGMLGALLYGERGAFDPSAALNQPGLLTLTLLIPLATAFLLIVVPIFLRRNLLLPLSQVLDGVARVNAGELTGTVPVYVHDELGFLAKSFNQMTDSLRGYATQMEGLVAQRTAELEHQKEALQRTLEELRATQTQLVQREKLASLGELTAGIAHEIQNPLNFVANFAEVSAELVSELAEEQGQLPRNAALEAELLASLHKNLNKISDHGRRAARIVQGMLEHARPVAGACQATDVNALCAEYLRLACHGLDAQGPEDGITLTTDFAPGLPQVSLVPSEIGRVLLNVCSNAFYAVRQQAMVLGGSYRPTVHVSTRRCGAQVELCVYDNGVGMSAAVREKVFQPFFTTKPTGDGTGLGLSLAYDIVTKGNGGTLSVTSCEGEGTEFVIALPV